MGGGGTDRHRPQQLFVARARGDDPLSAVRPRQFLQRRLGMSQLRSRKPAALWRDEGIVLYRAHALQTLRRLNSCVSMSAVRTRHTIVAAREHDALRV